MFMGEFYHTIDDKGRVIVPTKFREELGEKFIVTKGLENCLFLYPLSEWAVIEEKLRVLPTLQKEVRAFVRFFVSGAAEGEMNKQGRVSLPQNLREYASLIKDVVFTGVLTRIEIWDAAKWKDYSAKAEADYEKSAGNILDAGI